MASLDEYAVLMRTLGRLSADVEGLEVKWQVYRDEIKKLVNRLEKRDQRAEKRELEATGEEGTPEITPLRARVLGRRR